MSNDSKAGAMPDAETERLPVKAESLIPHSGPMCVISELIEVGENSGVTTAEIRADSPFLRADGTVEEAVFVEMIAQSIAAANGFEVNKEKRKSQEGYLVGIKGMKVTGTARLGDILTIRAVKYAEYGGFGIIEGSVSRGDEVLARGELKVLQIFEKPPLLNAGV